MIVLSSPPCGKFPRALRLLPLIALLLLLPVLPGCSRKSDLPEARKHLDSYLSDPGAGPEFDRFLDAWEDAATIEELASELTQRRSRVDSPIEEAELLLAEALASLSQRNPEWMRESFTRLSEHPAFGDLLTKRIESGDTDVIEALLGRAIIAFQPPKSQEEDAEAPFGYGGPGLAFVYRIADVPAALWPLFLATSAREELEPELAERLLRRVTYRSYTHSPERIASFLLHSPLLKPTSAFDPVVLEQSPSPTLMELIANDLRRGLPGGFWDRIEAIIDGEARDALGTLLLKSQRLPTDQIPPAAAAAFEQHLEEIKRLDHPRQATLAGLASRMSVGRGPITREETRQRLQPFFDWLASFGESSPGKELAGTWLAATSWENLPGGDDYGAIKNRLYEMVNPLRSADPKVARQLLIHVSRLDLARFDPEEAANRTSTIGEDVLQGHLFDDRSARGRAFVINTFVEGSDTLGISFWEKLDEWQAFDLSSALSVKGDPDARFEFFVERLGQFASALEIEDKRILIGSAVHFASEFPKRGFSIEDFRKRLEAIPRETTTEAGSDHLADVLDVFTDAARLVERSRAGRKPNPENPVEATYLDALRSPDQTWMWKWTLGSSLIYRLDGRVDDAFLEEVFALLLEGYRDGHRVARDHEASVVREIDSFSDPTKLAERRERLLEAWTSRFLAGPGSVHANHVIGRMLRLSLEQGNPDRADRLLETFSSFRRHPAAFVSAVMGGAPDLALDLQTDAMPLLHFHPRQLDPVEDFDALAVGYLEHLENLPPGSLDENPASALAIHARAMFLSLDGMSERPDWQERCRKLAGDLAAAYRNASAPPPAIDRALYLMAGLPSPPEELGEPLRAWYANFDTVALFARGTRYHDIDIRPVQLHVVRAIEARDEEAMEKIASDLQAIAELDSVRLSHLYRNPFFQETLGAAIRTLVAILKESSSEPRISPVWFRLFRALTSIPSQSWEINRRGREGDFLVATTILCDRQAELGEWWSNLRKLHRDFLLSQMSEKRNVLHESARILRNAPWIRNSPDYRKDAAIALLSLPVTKPELIFTSTWRQSKFLSADELRAWGPDFIENAPREGYTAFWLAHLHLLSGELETALQQIDLAVASGGPAPPDTAVFQLKRAEILGRSGRTAEANQIIGSLLEDSTLPPDRQQKARDLRKEFAKKPEEAP